ncbi:DNA-directed RNA polymerase [Phlyctochytrium planicorne]|nr:DNA-directed RNA polymerase [Phlyctochytrium planicorne]
MDNALDFPSRNPSTPTMRPIVASNPTHIQLRHSSTAMLTRRPETKYLGADLASVLADLERLRNSRPAGVTAMQGKWMPFGKKKDTGMKPESKTQVTDELNTILFPHADAIHLPLPVPVESTGETAYKKQYAVSERIAMIFACINVGDISRAEILFHRAWRTSPIEEMRSVVSTGMINAFVEGFLGSGTQLKGTRKSNFERAMEWHHRIEQFGLEPDSTTYAIMVKHLLTKEDLSQASKLITEMEDKGLVALDLLTNYRFAEPDDRAILESLLRSMHKLSPESSSVLADNDALMLSALHDATVQKEESRLEVDNIDAKARKLRQEDLAKTDSIGVGVLTKMLASLNKMSYSNKVEKQQLLEERSLAAADEEQQLQSKRLPEDIRTVVQTSTSLTSKWHKQLVPLIAREIQSIENATSDADEHQCLPFLKLLTPEQLSKLTITSFVRISTRVDTAGELGAHGTTELLQNIGSSIEQEFNIQCLKKSKNRNQFENMLKMHNLHLNGALFDKTVRRIMTILAMKDNDLFEKENWCPKWPDSLKVQTGSVLAALLIKVAKINVPYEDASTPSKDIYKEELAFSHDIVLDVNDGMAKRKGLIKVHPALLEILSKSKGGSMPRLLPMVVKPKPWLSRNNGGYLTIKSDVARASGNPEHMAYIAAADEKLHLVDIYHSLDVLGSTAWRVNEKVYDVARQVWNSGKELGDIPPAKIESELPQPENWDSLDVAAKRDYYRAKSKLDAARMNAFSQRCEVNYKLEIARAFLGETIYFPHNMDFRGRAYPIPLHLNHMGNDLCRGLLMFDLAKPLGKDGLKWLKIQVANLAGHDKISFADRVKFTESVMDEVMDSADKPLEGRRWWLKADDPWQLLATCIELTSAVRSPKPEEFLSRVPIHQDGTCNGLQHYAALGGDIAGALQVNLLPTEKPSDIYSAVADRVARRVDADAEKGCEISLKMKGRITRKLVKQTVMTNTYGVTFVGARKQVTSRMREQPDLYPFSDDEINKFSLHITKLIFDGLGELFQGARALQNWLNNTASLIAKSIPMESIPRQQLEDTKFLQKIGVLPKQANGLAEVDDLEESPKTSSSLLDAAMADESTDDVTVPEPAVVSSGKAKSKPKDGKVEKMASVIWTTPLGLPIVQPYRDVKLKGTCLMVDREKVYPVNPRKQSSAFPPNFVHSLDATHMMLSAIGCQRAGIEFASVHDSYWTHASDVKSMSTILRDAFVQLHSQEIMKKLRDEFLERYKSHKFAVSVEVTGEENLAAWKAHLASTSREASAKTIGPKSLRRKVQCWVDVPIPELPSRGQLDLSQVKESPYFFH